MNFGLEGRCKEGNEEKFLMLFENKK